VWRGGTLFEQSFCRGAATGPMASRPAGRGAPASGTRVEFKFDAAVFSPGVAWEPETIAARLRELAFLNPAATLRLRVVGGKPAGGRRRRTGGAGSGDEEPGGACGNGVAAPAAPAAGGGVDAEGWQVFHYEGGLQEYVQW
jgi:DNA gyrase/topoisomerase IV subunit B